MFTSIKLTQTDAHTHKQREIKEQFPNYELNRREGAGALWGLQLYETVINQNALRARWHHQHLDV